MGQFHPFEHDLQLLHPDCQVCDNHGIAPFGSLSDYLLFDFSISSTTWMARIECLLMTQELRGVRSDGVRSALLYPEIKSPGRDPRISPLSSPTSHPLMSDTLSPGLLSACHNSYQRQKHQDPEKRVESRKDRESGTGVHVTSGFISPTLHQAAAAHDPLCPDPHFAHGTSSHCPPLPATSHPLMSDTLCPGMPGIHYSFPSVKIRGSWKFNLILIRIHTQIRSSAYEPN